MPVQGNGVLFRVRFGMATPNYVAVGRRRVYYARPPYICGTVSNMPHTSGYGIGRRKC
jgi:hypothetical protein